MRPCAPACDPALGLKPDSALIRPRRRAGSTPYFVAAASISALKGVAPEPVPVPEGAAAAVAVGPPAACSRAFWKVPLSPAGGGGVAGGAAGAPEAAAMSD